MERARTELVCTREDGRPARLPPDVRSVLEEVQAAGETAC